MNKVSLILAFSAGLLSFLSPCVLPLVPAYISYLTGTTVNEMTTQKDKFFAVYKALGFVLGFSIIFIIMGASVTTVGKLFIRYKQTFRIVSGLLIFFFGLHTTGLFKIKLLYREKRFLNFNTKTDKFSSVFMGMAFAAGWTPCVGQILASILLYAANLDTIGKGILLLVVYSLGLAIPFLLTAFAVEYFSKTFIKYKKHLQIVSIVSGILMMLMGILIFTNKVGYLTQYLNFINF